MAEALSADEIASLVDKAGVNPVAVRSNLGFYAILNAAKPPFDKKEVRQAINYAIPRQSVVDSVFKGLANYWEGVYPSVYPGYVHFNTYKYNLQKAKSLLGKAGFADGFSTRISFSSGEPLAENIAVIVQSSLRNIGVEASLQKLPPAAHSDLVSSRKAEFALFSNFPIQPDPNYSMRLQDEVRLPQVGATDDPRRRRARVDCRAVLHHRTERSRSRVRLAHRPELPRLRDESREQLAEKPVGAVGHRPHPPADQGSD
jgi:ABC-type transport system substrate-binding protein